MYPVNTKDNTEQNHEIIYTYLIMMCFFITYAHVCDSLLCQLCTYIYIYRLSAPKPSAPLLLNIPLPKPTDRITMKTAWQRLIRFVATDGRVLYGEPILPRPDFDLGDTNEQTGLQARIIQGADLYDESGLTKVTDEVVNVRELLGPLTPSTVPIVRCIGLNYLAHSEWYSAARPSARLDSSTDMASLLAVTRLLILTGAHH